MIVVYIYTKFITLYFTLMNRLTFLFLVCNIIWEVQIKILKPVSLSAKIRQHSSPYETRYKKLFIDRRIHLHQVKSKSSGNRTHSNN